MATVKLSLETAAAQSLGLVTGTANAVIAAITVLEDLALVAAAHSSSYRETTIAALQDNVDNISITRNQELTMATARKMVAMEAELAADSALAAMYEKVKAERSALQATRVKQVA